MDGWLVVARSWYLVVAAGGLLVAAGGIGGEVAPAPALVGTVVGILSLAAVAWVRSASVARGMLASIGIAIGALAVGTVATLSAIVVDALGVLPGAAAYAAAAVPSGIGVGAAAIMWRRSARPCEDTPPWRASRRAAPRA